MEEGKKGGEEKKENVDMNSIHSSLTKHAGSLKTHVVGWLVV